MGYKDADFTWVIKARLLALEGVAAAARRVAREEPLDEGALDLLSDMLFVLDREEQGWAGSSATS